MPLFEAQPPVLGEKEFMSDWEVHDWRKSYEDALLETDARRLPRLIAAAENVLFLRWRELPGSPGENTERVAINGALNNLRLLKTDKRKAHASPVQAGASLSIITTREIAMFERTKPSKEQISHRAYELYVERGSEHGKDVEDWMRAEKELSHSIAGSAKRSSRSARARDN
jgi:phage anti-repressor protein